MAKGLLCKETHKHVIRFAPPLIIQKEDIDWAFERIEEVLTATDLPESGDLRPLELSGRCI